MMKIAGQKVEAGNEDVLVLPRSSGNVVFHGRAIHDFEEFNKLCPTPKPPALFTKHGKQDDVNDDAYLAELQKHGEKKLGWMVMKTLEPSDIEWESVNSEKPSTWPNWVKDVSESLNPGEQQRLLSFVMEVNSLDESKVEAARADFLRGRDQAPSEQ